MAVDFLRLLDHGILVVTLACFCTVGLSLPWVVVQHLRLRRKGLTAEAGFLALPIPTDDELPHVLVQLPTCNDGVVICRVAEACGNLDWPRGKLHIQMLDDSSDGTKDIA